MIEFRVDDTVVQAKIAEGQVDTSGSPQWPADVVIRTDGETLLGLSSGEVEVGEAEEQGWLEVEGDRRLFRAALRIFAAS